MPEQERKRIRRVEHFNEIIKECGGDVKKLQQVIASADPDELIAQFTKSLKKVHSFLHTVQHPAMPPAAAVLSNDRFGQALDFLNAMAEISNECKDSLINSGLYLITVDELRADNVKIDALKRLVAYALQTDVLNNLQAEILRELAAVRELADQETGFLLDSLKKTIKQVSHDELNDVGRYANFISNSNNMYDPYKKLGVLFAAMYFVITGADLEEKNHPNAKVFEHESLNKNDGYSGLRRSISGAPM